MGIEGYLLVGLQLILSSVYLYHEWKKTRDFSFLKKRVNVLLLLHFLLFPPLIIMGHINLRCDVSSGYMIRDSIQSVVNGIYFIASLELMFLKASKILEVSFTKWEKPLRIQLRVCEFMWASLFVPVINPFLDRDYDYCGYRAYLMKVYLGLGIMWIFMDISFTLIFDRYIKQSRSLLNGDPVLLIIAKYGRYAAFYAGPLKMVGLMAFRIQSAGWGAIGYAFYIFFLFLWLAIIVFMRFKLDINSSATMEQQELPPNNKLGLHDHRYDLQSSTRVGSENILLQSSSPDLGTV